MPFKLDRKDRKLLTLLDENCRQSNAQLARKLGLSKPAVEYRIRRLEKNNIIFEYYTVIDFTRLGFSQYKLYFKFQNATPEEENKIIEYWNKSGNIVWVAQLRGRWDLAVSVLARSNFEFGRLLNRFMNEYSGFILDKDVLLTEYSPIYAREYMTETEPKEFIYGIPEQVYHPDSAEKKILKQISTDARIPIVELSRRTGLTRDIINYRLKKLSKDRIIDHFRCYPNLEEIGVKLYKIIFRTKNFDENAEKKIKAYVAGHKKAPQMLKLIGSWDLEIEFEVETEDELYRHLTDIRKRFSSIIRDFEILRVTKTCKYDYFPF
ncbi:winged helix-turn-helix transcriptional regulator [Candidatus Woesearchaeota archaeon]|nr:winged helix-turn-helix transcriptional regulator [Candidatus Woesearchaeota archaeon]